ncbi:MAG: glycosyltransferase family 4 protein [Verrucomicrobiia bacterium]
MKIVQITPGAGGMFCGGCFRDNALVAAWRKLGHEAVMLPLYLPMSLDEEDQSRGAPIFLGGVNVYLQQKSPWFSRMPGWARRILDSPRILKLAAGSAAKTRAADVGALTVSMLRGEEGRQAREIEALADWLDGHFKPDAICLSNALLLGLARPLKRAVNAPVVCLLAGEDSFLDGLPEPHRTASWSTLQDRARDVDSFIAPSVYFAELMTQRLRIDPSQVKVVPVGINLEGYAPAKAPPEPPVLGFFARMCREKGLDALVKAFIRLKERDRVKGLRLRVGGGLSPVDEASLVKVLRKELESRRLLQYVDFCPNLTREQKLEFYRSLTLLSVPALYGEAFGLYLVEAWASGLPVVQPRHAAFPELVELTGAGVLYTAGDDGELAARLEELLLDPERAKALGQAGFKAATEHFNIERTAANLVLAFEGLPARSALPASPVA